MSTVRGFTVQGYDNPVKYDYNYLENKLELDPSLTGGVKLLMRK